MKASLRFLHLFLLASVLFGMFATQASAERPRILFFAGPASHGWGSHQHPAGSILLSEALRQSGADAEVTLTYVWPDAARLRQVDALVIYADGWWRHPATNHLEDLEAFMNRGGGLTVLHWATGIGGPDLGTQKDHQDDPLRRRWRSLVGADFEPWHSVSRFWDASFQKLADHEVTHGVQPFTLWDECYFHLRCNDPEHAHVTRLHEALPPVGIIHPGRAADSGSVSAVEAVGERKETQYCAWGFERPGGGRAFGYTGGHLHWNWARDELRKLILNGIYWSSGASVPSSGLDSPRPRAEQMLANLEGNPGWTPEDLQPLLDRASKGELIHWTDYSGGALPKESVAIAEPNKFEAEALTVRNATGGHAARQSMSSFGAGLWSDDAQLWWTGGKPGDLLELELPVKEAGTYQLGVGLTKAVDYGQIRFLLDGEPLTEMIDGYHRPEVIHTGEIRLGNARSLSAGTHTLAVEILGSHPDAVAKHMVGLDYVRLVGLPEDSQSLFDGATLNGWEGSEDSWRVQDGMLIGEIPDGTTLDRNEFLFWEGTLADFELRLQFRIEGHPSTNSGVQFRSERTAGNSAAGYQADIDDGATWVGRLYDEHGRALIGERGTKVMISETGERQEVTFRKADTYKELVKKEDWNDYIIRAVGPHIQTWINGVAATDLLDGQLGQHDYEGLLAFQLHSGPAPAKVMFKDIVLTPLGSTDLPEVPDNPNGTRSGISPKGKNLGFEEGTLRGWKAEGDVWQESPVKGDTVSTRRPGQASQHDGHYWVGGYERSRDDSEQGTLTSETFEVTHPWGSFLVGGGKGKDTRVEIVDADSNNVLFQASGEQQENMRVVEIDLREHQGKQIMVRVVDASSGAWGHINYDDFRFHTGKPNETPSRVQTNAILRHLQPNPAAGDDAHPTIAGMWVPEGFRVDLIATDPDITQPVAFTFDERGRLWFIEAHSYPRKRAEGEGLDRVVILEDSDGDGAFETRKVFIEGLNLASGIEVGFGGVWIGAAPELLFIPDHDRDDEPDGEPVVLLDGWGYQDTHETLNSFTWGPDGWLYGNQGVFCHSRIGKPGTPDPERVEMRAGVWRYHPTRHAFEIFATGCSNQWGIDFNEVGHLFITHCRSAWGGGPTTYVVQGGHYWNQSNSHHAPFVASGKAAWNPGKDPIFRNFLLSSAGYGHGEGGAGAPGSRALYGGHSHVGTMIYLGSNWPERYRDQLFTHNLHGHQMNRQINVRKGSGYETVHGGSDQLFIADPEFIGVDLKYGPDGAVYMIDWVDKQHCHNNNIEVWDRSNGRLYRMVWEESYTPVSADLSAKSSEKLLDLVGSRDEWTSRMARRLLQERADASLVAAVETRFEEAPSTREALRYLWTRHLLGAGYPPLEAFAHESEEVRAWAITLSADGQAPPVETLLGMASSDPSAMVRLALASAMQRLPVSARWHMTETLASKATDADDPYLPKLIWYGIAPVAHSQRARLLAIGESTPMTVLSESIVWALCQDRVGRDLLVSYLGRMQTKPQRVLRLMSEAMPANTALPTPEGWAQAVASLRTPETEGMLDRLGGIFGDATVLAKMRKRVVDTTLPQAKRQEAFDFLRVSGDTECADACIALLEEEAFRSQALQIMGRFDNAKVAVAILAQLPKLEGVERNHALVALSAKPILAQTLLSSIESGTLSRDGLTSLHIRQMQALEDPEVTALLTKVWGRVQETSEDARKQIADLRKVYQEAPKWAHKRQDGQAVYQKLCATCHVMNGSGVQLGPDLTGSWRNGVDYFLENIIDPNAVVGESYQLNVVTTKDGTVVSGMPEGETATALSIRTVTESVSIPKGDIQSRQILEQSMMPAGLLEALTEKEIIDLLKFLSTEN